MSVGDAHTLALSSQGAVYSFGAGSHGRLGHGSHDGLRAPKQIETLRLLHVIAVSAGAMHSIVLTSEGRVCNANNSPCIIACIRHSRHTYRDARDWANGRRNLLLHTRAVVFIWYLRL